MSTLLTFNLWMSTWSEEFVEPKRATYPPHDAIRFRRCYHGACLLEDEPCSSALQMSRLVHTLLSLMERITKNHPPWCRHTPCIFLLLMKQQSAVPWIPAAWFLSQNFFEMSSSYVFGLTLTMLQEAEREKCRMERIEDNKQKFRPSLTLTVIQQHSDSANQKLSSEFNHLLL